MEDLMGSFWSLPQYSQDSYSQEENVSGEGEFWIFLEISLTVVEDVDDESTVDFSDGEERESDADTPLAPLKPIKPSFSFDFEDW